MTTLMMTWSGGRDDPMICHIDDVIRRGRLTHWADPGSPTWENWQAGVTPVASGWPNSGRAPARPTSPLLRWRWHHWWLKVPWWYPILAKSQASHQPVLWPGVTWKRWPSDQPRWIPGPLTRWWRIDWWFILIRYWLWYCVILTNDSKET